MDTVPVQLVFLTFLAGTQAHPHTAPVPTCPTTAQIQQCSTTNNFVDSFLVGIDPKSWTKAHMDVVCENEEEFISFATCLLSAERQCVGSGSENLVMDPNLVYDYHHFACQEKHKVIDSCVTTNAGVIEDCYNNAVALIATTAADYQCLWGDELRKCYVTGYKDCIDSTKDVINILLQKRKPAKCGSDVFKASFSFIAIAALVAMLASKKH